MVTRKRIAEEIKRRIDVAVWAYAYEMLNLSLVSDARFDKECLKVNPYILTGRPIEDEFFKKEFAPFTGQWVHRHPDKAGLHRIYLIKRRKK